MKSKIFVAAAVAAAFAIPLPGVAAGKSTSSSKADKTFQKIDQNGAPSKGHLKY